MHPKWKQNGARLLLILAGVFHILAENPAQFAGNGHFSKFHDKGFNGGFFLPPLLGQSFVGNGYGKLGCFVRCIAQKSLPVK
jgi:hypothetical protein